MGLTSVPCPKCGSKTIGRSSVVNGKDVVCTRACSRFPMAHRIKAWCRDRRGVRVVLRVEMVGEPVRWAGPNCRFDGCDRLRAPAGQSGRWKVYCYGHDKQRQRYGQENMKPLRWTGQTCGTAKRGRRVPPEKGVSRASSVTCWLCDSATIARSTVHNGMRGVVARICASGHRAYYRRDGRFLGTRYRKDGRSVLWLALEDGA